MKKYKKYSSAVYKYFLFLVGFLGMVQVSFGAGADSSWEMTSPLDPQHRCHQFVHNTFLGKLDDGSSLLWGAYDSLAPFSKTGTISSLGATGWESNPYYFCALAAIFDDGTVDATGARADWYADFNADAGGKLPDNFPKNRKVISIASTAGAFAVLLEDDKTLSCNLKVWGNSYFGGTQPTILIGKKVAAIASCYDGFVALLTDGTLKPWGGENFQGNLPSDFPKGKKVIALASNWGAFVALFEDKTIFSWGSPDNGGKLPEDFPQGRPVDSIASSKLGFAVLFKDGGIYSWEGHASTLPADCPTNEKATAIAATEGAFAALFDNGHVYPWGLEDFGGAFTYPFPQGKVVSLAATRSFFIAQLDDQTTCAWGALQDWSVSSDEKVTSITTVDEAVALLHEDGTVNVIGNENVGGTTPIIPDGKKILSIQGKSMSPPITPKPAL